MKPLPLHYARPDRQPRLILSIPSMLLGLAAGTLASLIYLNLWFHLGGGGWVPLCGLAAKLLSGLTMLLSDDWRRFGFGVILSIIAGFFIFAHLLLRHGWCC